MEQRTTRLQRQGLHRLLLAALLFVTTAFVQAQNTDSLKQQLQHLLMQYHQHQLSDRTYLVAVDSVVQFLYTEDSLAHWLETYRQIAFANKELAEYQAYY